MKAASMADGMNMLLYRSFLRLVANEVALIITVPDMLINLRLADASQ